MMLRPSLYSSPRPASLLLRGSRLTALLAGVTLAVLPVWGQSSRSSNAAAQQQSPYHGAVVEDIIARINDQIISRSDYDRAQQDLQSEARQQGWSPQQLMEQQRDLLRGLVDKQLLLSRGKQLNVDPDAELVRRLDEIRKQNHLDSMEALQKAAESQGVSFEDFKEQIRENIITSDVIGQEVSRHIQISPNEIQDYYNAHQKEFEKPEQVHLSEILIPTANPDDSTQVADAQKKADDVEAKLKAGGDFATLAKSSSGGPTAAQGGDLGDFKRGQLAKVLEDQTFDLKENQFTGPIRTRQGFVILKVMQHTEGGLSPEKDVENQIEEQIGYSKMQPALRAYLTKLRDDAYIDIKPGYVDSGASPDEQKPVYSAYVPPSKKKKREQRTRYRQVTHRRGRMSQTTETANANTKAPAPPSGVPTLDKVNAAQNSGTKQQASAQAYTQKPGKKEKIRFGQAPRETLPPAQTAVEDAGAGNAPAGNAPNQNAENQNTEVASGNVPAGMQITNPDGSVLEEHSAAPKKKSRFEDRARLPKDKSEKAKINPFAPLPVTTEEEADRSEQSTPLGLQGDTLHKKKPNPAKSGPKRRMTDEDRKKTVAAGTDSTTQTPAAPSAPAAPAPAAPQQ
ncbi:peptidylprolyl isomerase [Paracidobacterium acidisoli]|nr:peptidylprolyl isomerase [Paracidobacterium acidisoli]MBT9332863.1 peptidylprolyl isomerase [Paracidobacterium acidisoli]